MNRDEENMMLSFLEASAQNDMSQSERYASEAKWKQAFLNMYRAKSQECEDLKKDNASLRANQQAVAAPQHIQQIDQAFFFSGNTGQVIGQMDQQTIQTTDTNERTDN